MAAPVAHTAPHTDAPLIANPWLRWGVMLGVYTLITLFFYSQTIVGRTFATGHFALGRVEAG